MPETTNEYSLTFLLFFPIKITLNRFIELNLSSSQNGKINILYDLIPMKFRSISFSY
jgi:hypothetical protein